MALETLKDVKEIGGFSIVVMDRLRETNPEMFRPDGSMHYHLFEEKIRPFNFVYLREDVNSLTFNLQRGAIKEVGINGCQVDTLIEAARLILEGFNKQIPSRETSMMITKLDEALLWSIKRKQDREKRNVEGFNKI